MAKMMTNTNIMGITYAIPVTRNYERNKQMNKVILVGNLTKDPQLSKTQSGISITKFTVAVTKKFKDKEETAFVSCVAWQGLADVVANYATKGTKVALVGRITTGSYDDKTTGKKVYTTDVTVDEFELLGSKEAKTETHSEPKPKPQYAPTIDIDDLNF